MLNPTPLVPMVRDRLYEQVAQQIQQMIVAEGLPVGSRILTERELGDQFGVSRTVIREALKALAERGLVAIRPGRGTFVANPGNSALKEPMKLFFQRQNISYSELVEARRILEVEIAGLAAQRARPEQVEKMKAAVAEMDSSLGKGEQEGYVLADQKFHLALAEATQNKMFPMLTAGIEEILYESRRLIWGVKGSPIRGQLYHRALLEAVAQRDVIDARKAMQEHIRQVDTDIHAVDAEVTAEGTDGMPHPLESGL